MSNTSDGPFDNHILYQSLHAFVPANMPRWKKRLWNASDSFLSLFVIAPLAVSFWRGSWEGMDKYPDMFPVWNCFILGAVLHCAFAILREPLNAKFNKIKKLSGKSRIKSLNLCIVKKLYTYMFGIACISHWRGGWGVMEHYFGN